MKMKEKLQRPHQQPHSELLMAFPPGLPGGKAMIKELMRTYPLFLVARWAKDDIT